MVYAVLDLSYGNVSQDIFGWAHFSLLLHKDGFLLFPVVTSQLGCQSEQWYIVSSMGPASLPQHHITIGDINIFGYSPLQQYPITKGFAMVHSLLDELSVEMVSLMPKEKEEHE